MGKTYEQLLKEKEELEARIEEARKNELSTAIAEVKTIIAKYKLTAEDCGFSNKGRPKTKDSKEKKVAYRNPEKPEETWAGHGKKPDWLNKKLNAGAKLEDFKV